MTCPSSVAAVPWLCAFLAGMSRVQSEGGHSNLQAGQLCLKRGDGRGRCFHGAACGIRFRHRFLCPLRLRIQLCFQVLCLHNVEGVALLIQQVQPMYCRCCEGDSQHPQESVPCCHMWWPCHCAGGDAKSTHVLLGGTPQAAICLTCSLGLCGPRLGGTPRLTLHLQRSRLLLCRSLQQHPDDVFACTKSILCQKVHVHFTYCKAGLILSPPATQHAAFRKCYVTCTSFSLAAARESARLRA